MTEQRDDHEATAKRIVQGWIDGGEKDDLIAAVAAALAEAHHCKDCCCARSWGALGILDSKGMSIPEHIDELRAKLAEADILVQRQVEDVTRRLFDDIETLKAERDAGFVRGLERAKEMFRDQHVVTVTDFIEMIDAEIDKAGKATR